MSLFMYKKVGNWFRYLPTFWAKVLFFTLFSDVVPKALKSLGWVGGMCDYRVSSVALAKSLTIFPCSLLLFKKVFFDLSNIL